MRGRPIDAPALRAGEKPFLGGKNVRRDKLFNRMLGAWLEHRVAFRAARKCPRQRFETASQDDLAQLLAVAIAFDEKKVGRLFLFEATITGKDETALLPRGAD